MSPVSRRGRGNISSGAESGWEDGNKERQIIYALSILLSATYFIPFFFTSCTTSSEKSQSSESWSQEVDENEENSAEEDDDEDATDNGPSAKKIPHPDEPTAFHTRTLLMTHRLPDAWQFKECREQIEGLSSEATNQSSLLTAEKAMMDLVHLNLELYHWCFYDYAAALDRRLEQDASLMDEKADDFFATMRTLWVLARALDKERDSRIYFRYLRLRYIQISKDYFGRDLETVANPLANMPKSKNANWQTKPAGPVSFEE